MQFPVTRTQLLATVGKFGFGSADSEQIVKTLETEGRIELSGSMLMIKNPTDPDAQTLSGLCREARGASSGAVGDSKIYAYLAHTLQDAQRHGSSRRV